MNEISVVDGDIRFVKNGKYDKVITPNGTIYLGNVLRFPDPDFAFTSKKCVAMCLYRNEHRHVLLTPFNWIFEYDMRKTYIYYNGMMHSSNYKYHRTGGPAIISLYRIEYYENGILMKEMLIE